MKDKMVLGGIAKEGIRIYHQKQRDKRIAFYLSIMGMTLLYSLITGDWQVSLAGLVFSTITISADSASQFESGGAELNVVTRLADDKFAIAFADADDNNKGKVIIGTRSGTTITIIDDSATIFEAGQTDAINICSTDSTHFIISYRDITDSNKGKVVACSVSGTTITVGTLVEFQTAITDTTGIDNLDSQYFVIGFHETSGMKTRVKVGSLSGTTITLGSDQEVVAGVNANYKIDLSAFNDTYIIVTRHDDNREVKGYAGEIDTGNKTASFGSGLLLYGNAYWEIGNKIAIDCFDDTYFILFVYSAQAAKGKVVAGDRNAKVLSVGTVVTCTDGLAEAIGACTMDSTHFVIVFKDGNNANKGTIRGGSISGKTITLDADGCIVYESGVTVYPSICKLMSNYFVIGFKDNG